MGYEPNGATIWRMNFVWQIREASSPADYAVAHTLFLEYAAQLGHDLCFQHFEQELADLAGTYAPPRGRILLAADEGLHAGCVALRERGGDICEMKRLFVRPEYRQGGLGRRLCEEIIARARQVGYGRMRLDTLREMTSARALYISLGFEETTAYYDNPIPGAVYYELRLDGAR